MTTTDISAALPASMQIADPIARFIAWFDEAHHCNLPEPASMSVASVDAHGQPDIRIVLLRHVDERGFVFYTNFHSQKGHQLLAQTRCALGFHWMPLQRQVRVHGEANPVSDAEADAYFASRPRQSQIGAWASLQSQAMPTASSLTERIALMEQQFAGGVVPRPPHWSGFRIVPHSIEFWQEGAYRLHTRQRFTRDGDTWNSMLLFP